MLIRSDEAERNTILKVAESMVTAARTAPKGRGIDKIETVIIDGEDKDKLAAEIRRMGEKFDMAFFSRDAGNVDNSECVVVIGVRNEPCGLPHCGRCGFENCTAMVKAGGICALKIVDLGIALGSAVSLAADNRIDNRIMYTIGRAAVSLGLFSDNVTNAYGVPLSSSGKSLYYDR